jgi:diacylglycerol kinase (ATP)
MTVKIILNPYANRWGARAKIEAVKAALEACNIPFDLTVTDGPGDGIELAKDAASFGYESVVAAGGDGTISEVVNGLIATTSGDAPTAPLGILPIGTANDFSDMVKVPRNLLAAAQVINGGKTRQIDAGRITVSRNEYQYTHYFNNNCAVAMEPMVTLEHIKMTRLSGEIRYVIALIRALVKLKAWQMRITWDDGEYEGPTFLVSVCNSPRTGGFYMAPEASTDDGLLDFI